MSICVDLSNEQVDLIVQAVKDKLVFTDGEKEVKELEDIVWALGRGDELDDVQDKIEYEEAFARLSSK